MNRILGNLYRASMAATGVLLATSSASAETKSFDFETEFDLEGLVAAKVPASVPSGLQLDVSSAAAKWEQCIGVYLDALLDRATPAATVDASTEVVAALRAFLNAEIEAFTVAAVATAEPAAEIAQADAPVALVLNPLLLSPVLSHPMDCESCQGESKHAEAAAAPVAEPVSSSALAEVDDVAAWQEMADWASARAAEDAGNPDDATESAYFEIADESSPTN